MTNLANQTVDKKLDNPASKLSNRARVFFVVAQNFDVVEVVVNVT